MTWLTQEDNVKDLEVVEMAFKSQFVLMFMQV